MEELEIEFYTSNLKNGWSIEKKAIQNLLDRYSIEEINRIKNADEIGIVEYVASNDFYIENDMIIIDEL